MLMNQDDCYGQCPLPNTVMKSDPFLGDISSSPDIDESFLASFDDWLKDDPPAIDGAKQTLASSCYADDEAPLPSPVQLLNTETPQMAEKPAPYNEVSFYDEPKTMVRHSGNSINQLVEDEKQNFSYNPDIVIKKENNQSVKQAKRGRPMKITSHSKQALYAREYRRKNKMALWSYERKVAEQNQEIAKLMKQNEEMRRRLTLMTRRLSQAQQVIQKYSPSIAAELQDLTRNSA